MAAAVAEVSAQLGTLPAPVPLPLVPASRDLDPAQAITARLRAAPARVPTSQGGAADRPGPGDVGARPGERSGRLGAAAALR
ncbi:hypothetical protein KCW65_24710, partial [Mycobacterium tuberculosis]|nr:hypothetical protein [Mycobacterium tuberculosis]